MIPTEVLLDAFRSMLRIRHAEQAIAADFLQNKIFSFLHLALGQEAVAVGVSMALRPGDQAWGNHRSHGHYLAKGGDLYLMLCEIYGKADGCCRGRGGSMHVIDKSVGFMGSTPILGSVVPIATGCAFTQKANGSARATVVFFGDGASEEGVVYESINIAALWRLPIIYVVENNLYAVATDAAARRAPGFDLGAVVTGLGAKYFCANGNSFVETYKVAQLARIAALVGPVVLEAKVFRQMAHSGPISDEACRKVDTKDVRDHACPIAELLETLRGRGVAEERLFQIRQTVMQEVTTAMERAKAAPMPAASELREAVYV